MRPLLNVIACLVVLLGFVACGDKHAVPHELAPRSSADAIGDGTPNRTFPRKWSLARLRSMICTKNASSAGNAMHPPCSFAFARAGCGRLPCADG